MKRKIKVCIFSANAYPLLNKNTKDFLKYGLFGGAEIDMYILATYLVKTGRYDVTFWVGDYGQPQEEVINGIEVQKFFHRTNSNKSLLQQKAAHKAKTIKLLMSCDCDVYITEAASEYAGWLSLVEKVLRKKIFIFRLASDKNADLSFYKNDPVVTKKANRRIYRWYSFAMKNVDAIISQSEKQRDLLYKNTGLNSVVVKNGFYINHSVDFTDKKYILWVARGAKLKRPELFLEMAEKLPEETFVLIMPPAHKAYSFYQYIKSEAERINNVKFIDFVSYFEIQKYYNKAKLFVNTSEYEGFPNAFIQACIGATPILSMKVNPDEFLTKNKIGICCSDDINKAVNFIRSLDEEKIACYGGNALKYICENHNIKNIGKQYEDIIVSHLSRKKGIDVNKSFLQEEKRGTCNG